MLRSWLHRLIEYGEFANRFLIRRVERPFILGLVITDICNLKCRHCRVANVHCRHMPFEDVRRFLEDYYERGCRYLYLEGGEPYLWHDRGKALTDIVACAKLIGYFRVHVYTNGTFPLHAGEDFTWVSIDGLHETHQAIRGCSLERVLRNIPRTGRKNMAIIYTVNTMNYREIPAFLRFVQTSLAPLKALFYFHTPYYGIDALHLPEDLRREAMETILQSKRDGLPVLNSRVGLKAMLSRAYALPTNLWVVVDQTGAYQCCRAITTPSVCHYCGYSACAEILSVRDFKLSAWWQMRQMY